MGKLVQLEIENFKSYKGQQIIGPFQDFTSIIGPNGAGKSNLMDAISFVLGVRSSQLRSTNLKELIHRPPDGSKQKPLIAKVTAVYQLDNNTTINFNRSITANGTGEYRIDGKSVSYGEYSKTLEKENILIKAKNFLVFQGDVEAVASQSSNELTKLIELISGSGELKEEYDKLKESLDSLTENSGFQYNRKKAITSEFKLYTEQKAEVIRYQKMVEEKNEVLAKHMTWKLTHLAKSIKKAHKEIEELKKETKDSTKEQFEKEQKLKTQTKNLALLTKEMMKLKRELKKHEKTIDSRKTLGANLEENIKQSKKKLDQLSKKSDRMKIDMEKQEIEVQNLYKDFSEIKSKAKIFDEENNDTSELLNSKRLKGNEFEEYNKRKEQVIRMVNRQIEELDQMQVEHQTDQQSYDRVKSQIMQHKKRLEGLIESQHSTSNRIKKVEELKLGAETELEGCKKELIAIKLEKQRIACQEAELNEQLAETQSRLAHIQGAKRESEKAKRFKETLASLTRVFPGVHGRVVDLCNPIQRKYDTAISIILGRNIDSIVVDTEKTAIQCIEFLREQRLGTSTFLPLDKLSSKPVNERLRNAYPGSKLAIDVIQFNSEYQNAIQYSCGNALVCDNLDVAREICYEKGQKVKAVTLDGTIIHKSGLITGGQSESTTSGSRTWNGKEVEELRNAQQKVMDRLQELSNSNKGNDRFKSSFKDDQLQEKISFTESRLQYFNDDLSNLKGKMDGILTEISFVEKEIASLEPEMKKIETTIKNQNKVISKLKEEINVTEDKVFVDFCKSIGVSNIREYEEQHILVAKEIGEKRVHNANELSRLENQYTFANQRLEDIKKRYSELQDTITKEKQADDRFKSEYKSYQTENDKLYLLEETSKGNILNAEKKMETETKIAEGLKTEISQMNDTLDQIMKKISEREFSIDKMETERYILFRKCKLEEIQLPIIRGDLDDIDMEDFDPIEDPMDIDSGMPSQSQKSTRRIGDTIELDISFLTAEQRKSNDEKINDTFLQTIEKLSVDIDKLNPDMKSIQRLEDVKIRLEVVEKEFEQVRQLAKQTKDRFNSLKQERYKKFYSAFSFISDQIDPIYKELTQSRAFPLGGTAYLSLDNGEEPYLEGIKYHAMPPMKRFRDMEQLSGGEKTMAALALLFAIHSYQPSPFFVLDEVDAALDPGNVAKLAQYITKHASPTFQFIVISLKHTLYQKSEALVGIYKDTAVHTSKVLTLMLKEFEE